MRVSSKRKKRGKDGASGSKKRSKKGNGQKTAAYKSIRKFIVDFPDEIRSEWLSAAEILACLVGGGAPLSNCTATDVTETLNILVPNQPRLV
jgi:hypothetical protein